MVNLMRRAAPASFGYGSDKSSRNIGCPFIDIGRPEMKGKKRQFEKEPGKGENESQNSQGVIQEHGEGPDDIPEERRLANTINKAHTIEHDPG